MRPLIVLAALLGALFAVRPAGVEAQTLEDLARSVEQGGGWVGIPIVAGEGSVSTPTVPTMGITLNGCVQVWGGHSGTWDIEARDLINQGRLAVKAAPGQSVPFTYTAGMRSQLTVDVAWSERRDTTLLLWVGLERPGSSAPDACKPTEG
jgi:hypothetical protein